MPVSCMFLSNRKIFDCTVKTGMLMTTIIINKIIINNNKK